MRILLIAFISVFYGCSSNKEPSSPSEPLNATKIGNIDLVPTKVLDGKVELLIPLGFKLMDEEMLQFKYPDSRRPSVVYTDSSGAVNVAINHTNDRMSYSGLSQFITSMEKMFKQRYPTAQFYEKQTTTIYGRQWAKIDVQTPAIDTDIRNIMLATSLDGRLLLVSINVVKELEDEWLEPANAIASSIQVHD